MAKTLIDFRAEKGLYLKDLAEFLGLSESEFMLIENSGIIPEDIKEKLIFTVLPIVAICDSILYSVLETIF